MPVVVPYTRGQVLYRNLLRDALSVVYSGTETVGMELENAYDLNDWSFFATQSSISTTLEFTLPYGSLYDTIALMIVPFSTTELPDELIIGLGLIGQGQIGLSDGECTVTISRETGDGTNVWVDIATHTFTGTDSLWYLNLPALYVTNNNERLRMTFANIPGSQMLIREMSVGRRLEFEIGQHANVAPPSLASGFVLTNTPSMNGSLLGRQTRRVEKVAEIKLELLSPTWVYNQWNPFALFAAKYGPFFYSWNYYSKPEDSCLVTATDIQAPINMSGKPYLMEVSMPLRVIT